EQFLPGQDTPAPPGDDQRVGDLGREQIRGEQLVDPIAVVVPEPPGLNREWFGHDPRECGRGVDDVPHSASRISRMIWTPISWTPNLSSTSCRAFSERSRTRRSNSGSRTPPSAAWRQTSSRSARISGGISAVLICSSSPAGCPPACRGG